jgi:hypothetical protein
MGYKEKRLIDDRLRNLPENIRLVRINSGVGWVASPRDTLRITKSMTVRVNKGDVVLRRARVFHGAPRGTADLIGIESVEITPDMVGQRVAVFLAEEVKATGVLSPWQRRFRATVKRLGGIFRVVG